MSVPLSPTVQPALESGHMPWKRPRRDRKGENCHRKLIMKLSVEGLVESSGEDLQGFVEKVLGEGKFVLARLLKGGWKSPGVRLW